MHSKRARRAALALAVVAVVVLGMAPGAVAAQSESGIAGTVVVEEGETVEEVSGIAGNVIVDGTVTGDVSGVAGNVYVTGDVGGNVDTFGGNVEITGTVGGDVNGAVGNVVIADGATVGGEVNLAAGTVLIEGTIDGDASIAADTITLGEEASIGGDLTYDGDLEGETDAVAGEVTRDESLGPTGFSITGPGIEIVPSLEPLTTVLSAVYAFFLNLVLGAALLALFPRFSADVADRVATDPVRSGLAGLAVLVGVPVLLLAVAITIIGIPFSIVGAFAFAFVVWIGVVYGRFAVAAWLLEQADVDNRWLALVVGLLGGAILTQVPFIGGLVNFLVFLLGLGALAVALYLRRQQPDAPEPVESGEPTVD
ncbi:polymer-forming cytoskeletal protein [Natronobeatus ordinarius]|uniref:polymer-forming cytoskeletal protein n=1 Tax=Natronobeatus ordinarius TaxID=2963433 RepID=UPI0020CEA59C|nr:polymer-forming cytoskeletal protein [Natronobeatus ordinarius]